MDNKILSGAKKAAGAIISIGLAAEVLQQVTPILIEYFKNKTIDAPPKEKESLVEVPKVDIKEVFITVDDAVKLFKEHDLKPSKQLVHPAIKYKDCTDGEVVRIGSKQGKVKVGTYVSVKYVTSEVIEKSQKLYEESERKKEEKIKLKADQAESKKKKLQETSENVKQTIKEFVPKLTKKEVKKDEIE